MKTLIVFFTTILLTANLTFAQDQNDRIFIDTIMSALKSTGTLYRLAVQSVESTLKTDASYSNKICTLKIEIKDSQKVVKASFSQPEKDLDQCHQQITEYILKKFKKV